MLLISIVAAHAAPCEPVFNKARFQDLLGQAQIADANLDTDRTLELAGQLVAGLPCADFKLRSTDLALFYRTYGWALFTAEDPRSRAWLASAYTLQPSHPYDPPLQDLSAEAWARASAMSKSAEREALPIPKDGSILVDGLPADSVAVGHAWTLQHVSADGAVVATWVGDGPPLPTYATAKAAVSRDPSGSVVGSRKRSAVPPALVLVAGIGAAGAGGGLWGASALSQAKYCVDEVCMDDTGVVDQRFIQREIEPQRYAGIALTVAGAAIATTGVIWLASRGRRGKSTSDGNKNR